MSAKATFESTRELRMKFDDDRAFELHVAAWLRCVADHLETGDYPRVMLANVPDRAPDKPCGQAGVSQVSVCEAFELVLSHPWGG